MKWWLFGYGLIVLAVVTSLLSSGFLYFWFEMLFLVCIIYSFVEFWGGGYGT